MYSLKKATKRHTFFNPIPIVRIDLSLDILSTAFLINADSLSLSSEVHPVNYSTKVDQNQELSLNIRR